MVALTTPPRSRRRVPLLSQPALLERKAALRAAVAGRRQALGPEERARAATELASHIDELLAHGAGVVAGFWPLAQEIDPRPALNRLHARGRPLALPRMQGRDRPLAFHSWQPGQILVQGRFEVMEPPADAPVVEPDLVLVPLLAFDPAGRRVGHGAGFYDRTLEHLRSRRPGLRAIGIAFAVQEVEAVPVGAHDEPLDLVVTERGPIAIPGRAARA